MERPEAGVLYTVNPQGARLAQGAECPPRLRFCGQHNIA